MEGKARLAEVEGHRRAAAMRAVGLRMGRVVGQGAQALRARAAVPAACGPEIVAAPARGPVARMAPVEMRPVAEGWEAQHVGFQGRDAARVRDVWDRIEEAARACGAPSPFTASQVAVAREYAALVERHAASGMRGFSVEARVDGGGKGDGYADAVIAEGLRLEALRQAAEGRAVLGKGVVVSRLMLVDWVALGWQTPSAVLARCGVAAKGRTRERVRLVLAGALEAMARAGRRPVVKKGD